MGVTIKQIADLCGVSRGTVDRVINNRSGVNQETADAVRAMIKKLDYKPNTLGKALVGLKNPTRIGVILSPAYNPFAEDLKRGVLKAEKEFADFGVHVDVRSMSTLEAEEQVSLLKELEESGIDGVSLLPIESELVERSLHGLVDRGIPVVTFNSDLPQIKRLCFVGQDHLAGGAVAGNLMGKMVDGGKVAVIASSRHILCHIQRMEGFERKLAEKFPAVSIVGISENEDRDDYAYEQALSFLEDHGDLRGIYLTGGGSAGLGRALKHRGLAGRVRVVTHDFVESTVALIKDGTIDFSIGQDPVMQGYLPIKILYRYLTEEKRPKESFIRTMIDIRTEGNIE